MSEETAIATIAEDLAAMAVNGESDPDHKGDSAQEDTQAPVYLAGFDAPEAGVVLMGTDGLALRVHDYYLKAAR